MSNASDLFANNRRWSDAVKQRDPGFFNKLARQQARVISGSAAPTVACRPRDRRLLPGELFVHRNVANVVVHTDLNCLRAAVRGGRAAVEHVIVCGHYGCGGVEVAWKGTAKG